MANLVLGMIILKRRYVQNIISVLKSPTQTLFGLIKNSSPMWTHFFHAMKLHFSLFFRYQMSKYLSVLMITIGICLCTLASAKKLVRMKIRMDTLAKIML